MPSHRPVSRFRHVVPVLKRAARDPRFGQRSGKFNETMFKKAYSFLDGMKEGERQMAEKEMRKTRDPERRSQLHRLIQNMVITFHRAPVCTHFYWMSSLFTALCSPLGIEYFLSKLCEFVCCEYVCLFVRTGQPEVGREREGGEEEFREGAEEGRDTAAERRKEAFLPQEM